MSITKLAQASLIALATLSFGACATTRVVQTQPERGGVIAVHESLIGDARADAITKMKANCPKGKYKIVQEGEAKVGSNSSSNGDSKSLKHGLVLTSTESQTRDVTEWRIKYRCSK